MKKVVNTTQQVRVNGGEWENTSIRWHLRYIDVEEYKEEHEMYNKTTNWEDAMMFVEEHCLNGEVLRTMFRNRPYCLKTPTSGIHWNYTPKEKFESIELRIVLEEYKTITLDTLLANLPADEMCEYLKDKGVQYVVSR